MWGFVTFAPDPIKTGVLETGLAQVRGLAESLETQIETLKSAANPVLEASGYELRVKLDIDTLKKISLDDIQNLQTLATWGQFICASEVQAVLQPLYTDPIFRVIVELMGIPASKEDLQGVCGSSFQKPLAEVMKDQVEVVPKSVGGGARRRRLHTRRWRLPA